MVFESVVADLLNRFLGDYVENLDHSQLKIGIWGGKSNVTVVFFGVDVYECNVQQCVKKNQNFTVCQFLDGCISIRCSVFSSPQLQLEECVTIYVCFELCR
jgi:hypothetical protein